MNKRDRTAGGDMRKEYDSEGGVRGKHAAQFKRGNRVVVLDQDVAEWFKDLRAVNDALRALAELARRQARRPSR